jgi:hypothetical protein
LPPLLDGGGSGPGGGKNLLALSPVPLPLLQPTFMGNEMVGEVDTWIWRRSQCDWPDGEGDRVGVELKNGLRGILVWIGEQGEMEGIRAVMIWR